MGSQRRILILAEGYLADPHHGKTTRGVLHYGSDPIAAIVDSTFPDSSYEGISVVSSVADAILHQPTVALIGVAPTGGRLPPSLRADVVASIKAGLDVEAGLHEFLADDDELVALAAQHDSELRDLRRPPSGLGVPTGANLEHDASVILTVGSDCAIGKMTVSLELHREAERRGERSVFVPSGQTGIAIAGWGVSVDAVVADYIAGAAERIVTEGAARGDLLWVEGQGSLIHHMYSGVTLGLFHGSMPHLLVLCHKAGMSHLEGHPRYAIPPLSTLIALHERAALPARPARVVAVALNTSLLPEDEARSAVRRATDETGMVADDPVRFGSERIVRVCLEARDELQGTA